MDDSVTITADQVVRAMLAYESEIAKGGQSLFERYEAMRAALMAARKGLSNDVPGEAI